MAELEYRAVELRQSGPGVLEGVLIPYGTPSRIGGAFDEVFRAGSVRVREGLLANRQHDRSRPLARLGHGLELHDGPAELRAVLTLPDTADGRDVRALVDSGVLRGLSAEFRAFRDQWPAPDRRELVEVELRGVGVVDDPGHSGALIAEVRARLEAQSEVQRRRWW